jgi:3-hydroxyisobutyrate dehydrogenase
MDAAAPARPAVALVGAGRMGLGMVLRLRERGYALRVHDLDPAREALARAAGARIAGDAAAAAAGAEVLIVAVVDAAQTRDVLFGARGAAAALPAGAAVLLCPTIAADDVEAIAADLVARGLQPIDAPMSGGPQRARDGTMSLMVACADAAFDRWQGLLGDLASRLLRVGRRAGDGARTKLVNNLLAAVNLAGAAEALALAQRVGLDPALTLSVIEQSSGASWIGSDRLRRALAGDAAVHARIALLAKDSALALRLAARAGAGVPVGEAAARVFAAACAAGLADADDSALWRRALRAGEPGLSGAASAAGSGSEP